MDSVLALRASVARANRVYATRMLMMPNCRYGVYEVALGVRAPVYARFQRIAAAPDPEAHPSSIPVSRLIGEIRYPCLKVRRHVGITEDWRAYTGSAHRNLHLISSWPAREIGPSERKTIGDAMWDAIPQVLDGTLSPTQCDGTEVVLGYASPFVARECRQLAEVHNLQTGDQEEVHVTPDGQLVARDINGPLRGPRREVLTAVAKALFSAPILIQ